MKQKSTIILLIAMFMTMWFFTGCNSYQKQLKKFNEFADAHNDVVAGVCAQKFPVKDSIGQVHTDSTHRANNVNYSPTIDSLQKLADALKLKLSKDTVKTNPCAAVAKGYQDQVNNLTNQLIGLHKTYKPCLPDTVYRTRDIYRLDSAKLVVMEGRYKVKADSLVISQHDLTGSQKQSSTRLYIIIGLCVAIGVGIVLKIKSVI